MKKWMLIVVLLIVCLCLSGCFGDNDEGSGDEGGNDAAHGDTYWEVLEVFSAHGYVPDDLTDCTDLVFQIVILISSLQGIMWIVGDPVGFGGYMLRSA